MVVGAEAVLLAGGRVGEMQLEQAGSLLRARSEAGVQLRDAGLFFDEQQGTFQIGGAQRGVGWQGGEEALGAGVRRAAELGSAERPFFDDDFRLAVTDGLRREIGGGERPAFGAVGGGDLLREGLQPGEGGFLTEPGLMGGKQAGFFFRGESAQFEFLEDEGRAAFGADGGRGEFERHARPQLGSDGGRGLLFAQNATGVRRRGLGEHQRREEAKQGEGVFHGRAGGDWGMVGKKGGGLVRIGHLQPPACRGRFDQRESLWDKPALRRKLA